MAVAWRDGSGTFGVVGVDRSGAYVTQRAGTGCGARRFLTAEVAFRAAVAGAAPWGWRLVLAGEPFRRVPWPIESVDQQPASGRLAAELA